VTRPGVEGATCILCAGWLAALGLSWCALWTRHGELLASVRPWLDLSGLLPLALLCVLRRAVPAAVLAGILLFDALPDLALRLEPAPDAGPGRRLRVASANLLFGNPEAPQALERVLAEEPDVLLLLELDRRVARSAPRLRERFATVAWFPGPPEQWEAGTWGMALCLRASGAEGRARPLVPGALAELEASWRSGAELVVVRGLHLPDPSTEERWQLRERALRVLVERRDWDERSIVLGDLNLTSHSPSFGRFVRATGLADTRRGFGVQPSFRFPTAVGDLEFAIDHVLVGRAWRTAARRTIDLPGSDHRAVLVDLAEAEPRS